MMTTSRITLSNRPENLKLLLDFVGKWSRDRGLSSRRQHNLETAATKIFGHLVSHAYRPGQPDSIVISLEEKGPRLRLIFEDDAAPLPPAGQGGLPAPALPVLGKDLSQLNGLQQLAESLSYYRTSDRKNRLVFFLT